MQNKEFMLPTSLKPYFAASLPLLLCAALFSCGDVVTRTLYFRSYGTDGAEGAIATYDISLTVFCIIHVGYVVVTWLLFCCSCALFTAGLILLFISVGVFYANRLF